MEILLLDAIRRDPAIARRAALLRILLHERYLTREQLIIRTEGHLGKGCFGASAWEDVFYRDMRLVKKALGASGHHLTYSRSAGRRGYYLRDEPFVSAELSSVIRSSFSEVDPRQIEIFRWMTPAERFRLGCSVTETAIRSVAYRLRQRFPGLSEIASRKQAVQMKGNE